MESQKPTAPCKDAPTLEVDQTEMPQGVPFEMIEARRKFRRVLCAWAGDALALRRAGLDRPTFAAAAPTAARLADGLIAIERKR